MAWRDGRGAGGAGRRTVYRIPYMSQPYTFVCRVRVVAVWPLNSLIPLEEEENRAISPVVFAGASYKINI